MSKPTKGVLILNLGTPDSTKVWHVGKYLREFLMDWRVIDIPAVFRALLVHLLIVPFRSFKSAAEYRKLWTPKGSPLKYMGHELKEALQKQLGSEYLVEFGMRYQSPSLKSAIAAFKNKGFNELIVIPLYPHYASASTGSTIEAVNKELAEWQIIPNLKIISNFPNHPKFIEAWADVAKPYMSKEYDHYLFSYHGLPERQILKGSCDNYCQLDKCCNSYNSKNTFCYRAQCFETTRRLTEKLGIPEDKFSICFQSRLGREEWIKPYLDDNLLELEKRGIKKVLAFSPAFVADCLETTVEIGEAYAEKFLHEHGGEQWDLVESLNTNPKWVECVEALVKGN